jgi:hypothetical protein
MLYGEIICSSFCSYGTNTGRGGAVQQLYVCSVLGADGLNERLKIWGTHLSLNWTTGLDGYRKYGQAAWKEWIRKISSTESFTFFFTEYWGITDIAKLLYSWLWRRKSLHCNPRKVKNERGKNPQSFQICFSRYDGTCCLEWGWGKNSQCSRRVNMVNMVTKFGRILFEQPAFLLVHCPSKPSHNPWHMSEHPAWPCNMSTLALRCNIATCLSLNTARANGDRWA